MRNVYKRSGICVERTWSMFRIYLGYVKDMPGTDMIGKHLGHVWDMCGICMGYV